MKYLKAAQHGAFDHSTSVETCWFDVTFQFYCDEGTILGASVKKVFCLRNCSIYLSRFDFLTDISSPDEIELVDKVILFLGH